LATLASAAVAGNTTHCESESVWFVFPSLLPIPLTAVPRLPAPASSSAVQSMPSAVKDQSGPGGFPVIELYQLDKRKFFPLSTVGSLTVQVVTYPLTLLRTRLQLQEGHKVYRGLLHCFRTVLGQEGVQGLYAGFWVKNFQVLSSVMYAYTYERVREDTRGMSPTMRSFLGGGCASLVSQTVLVPLDVVSQHLQVLSRAPGASSRTLTPICISEAEASTAPGRALAVVRTLYRRNGVAAFYKGYVISIAHFVPNSALWWAFYNFYCDAIGRAAVALMSVGQPGPQDPQQLPPRLPVQLASAPLSGMSSGLITNPIDVVRVRMQVEGLDLPSTLRRLWTEEGAAF
uniref:Solute carrier family 25 member 44 n=1 Tax=Macrostomum lignano TaxID=282301 RepID=A0A1I8GDS3_9PLAT